MKSIVVAVVAVLSGAVALQLGMAQRGDDAPSGESRGFQTRDVSPVDAEAIEGIDTIPATLPPAGEAFAGTVDVGSDGSDGTLDCAWLAANATCDRVLGNCGTPNCTSSSPCTCTVDLGSAANGSWDTPGDGSGICDGDKWVVVFKYESIDIPLNVTVNFRNHPTRAPVAWLSQGDVMIAGTVSLNGAAGHSYTQVRTLAESGPGGFRGGRGADSATRGSGGMGPGGPTLGGDNSTGTGGSHAWSGTLGNFSGIGGIPGPVYGNGGVFPLIGGSGGSGMTRLDGTAGGGGAGGGAILIGSNSLLVISGRVAADGGGGGVSWGGGGAGGSIWLVGDTVEGGGRLTAIGGSGNSGGGWGGGKGGAGRIRVEANTITLTDLGNPAYTIGVPGTPLRLFPDDTTPRVEAVSLGGVPVPADPRAAFEFPGTDVSLPLDGTHEVVVHAHHVPLGPDTAVRVRVVDRSEPNPPPFDDYVDAVLDSGDDILSVWRAQVPLNRGFAAIQARATFPPIE